MRSLIVGGALLCCLFVAGCKQGQGDRCQVQADCDDGLLCILPNGGTPQAGGTCQPPGGFDGSVNIDMAVQDSSTDLLNIDQ